MGQSFFDLEVVWCSWWNVEHRLSLPVGVQGSYNSLMWWSCVSQCLSEQLVVKSQTLLLSMLLHKVEGLIVGSMMATSVHRESSLVHATTMVRCGTVQRRVLWWGGLLDCHLMDNAARWYSEVTAWSLPPDVWVLRIQHNTIWLSVHI